MMLSTKIAQMVLLRQKGLGRALDKKYLQMKSSEPLVQNKKKSQKWSSCCHLLNSAWLNNMATRAKIEIYFKSFHISIATVKRPIHHLVMCQDSGERSRALLFLVIRHNFMTSSFYRFKRSTNAEYKVRMHKITVSVTLLQLKYSF